MPIRKDSDFILLKDFSLGGFGTKFTEVVFLSWRAADMTGYDTV
jgi:hypothetical protein